MSDSCHRGLVVSCRCLAATKSDTNVRPCGNPQAQYSNLIIHHRITDILDQPAKFTRILRIVEESFNLPFFLQRDQISNDILQFPVAPCQTWHLSMENVACSPFQFLPPFLLLHVTLSDRFAELISKDFDSGCQRFYFLSVRLSALRKR